MDQASVSPATKLATLRAGAAVSLDTLGGAVQKAGYEARPGTASDAQAMRSRREWGR